MFWKLSSGLSRLTSIICALIAMLLVFASGPDQEAGLFGVTILLAIASSLMWTMADWMDRTRKTTRRSQITGQAPSRL